MNLICIINFFGIFNLYNLYIDLINLYRNKFIFKYNVININIHIFFYIDLWDKDIEIY